MKMSVMESGHQAVAGQQIRQKKDFLPSSESLMNSTRVSSLLISIIVGLICLTSQAHPAYGYPATPRRFETMLLRPHTHTPIAATVDVGNWNSVHGRVLLATNTSDTENFRPLAERSNRIDPLDHFHKYTRGYDLKNKHYWASVIWTGISGYAIAVAWLVLGLLVLLFMCCKCLCGKRPNSRRPRSRAYYWAPRLVVFLLSAAAIASSVILYLASHEVKTQGYNVEDVLVGAAQNATNTIHNVSSTLDTVETIIRPYSTSFANALNSTEVKLDSEAQNVNDKVFVNKKTYQKVFNIVEIVLLVITSFNLLLIVLGFASTFLRWRRFFYMIIVVAWIMTALTWVMFGSFIVVHNVADDTCLAVKEYLQDPTNTTLDALLPCADLASLDSEYLTTRKVLKTVLVQASKTFLNVTDGLTDLTGICDPIGPAPNYEYTGICANNTLPISQLTSVVQPFVCNSTASVCETKNGGKYVTEAEFVIISDYSKACSLALDTFPQIQSLTNCSVVTNTLNTLVEQRCGPAKDAINRIWIAFAILSSLMVLLIFFWCLANLRNSEQRYMATIIPQEQPIYSRPYREMEK